MSTLKWRDCMCIGLLTVGLSLSVSGCGGGGDDEPDGGGAGGTNSPAGGDDGTLPPLVVPATAPQLVSPDDDATLFVPSDVRNDLTFSWTAVPGATYYMVQVDDMRKDTGDTATVMTVGGLGVHTWKVWGMNNESDNPMPTSETFTFTLRKGLATR